MGGGGGSSDSVVNQNAIPPYAQPRCEEYMARANVLSQEEDGAWPAYTGVTYAPRNSNEVDGILAMATRACAGHPIIVAGEALLRDEVDGFEHGTNTKLDAFFAKRLEALKQDFEEETLPTINRAALLMGRWGSYPHNTLHARAAEKLAEAITALTVEVYGEDYFFEKERRIAALGHGIRFGSEDVRDGEFLRQAGLLEREYIQGGYDDEFKKWKEQEVAAVKRLEIMGNAIRAMAGAQVTTVTPFHRPSPVSQVAGLALASLSMYAQIYGGKGMGGTSLFAAPALQQSVMPQKGTQPSLLTGEGSMGFTGVGSPGGAE
jgi:hypothetical protein